MTTQTNTAQLTETIPVKLSSQSTQKITLLTLLAFSDLIAVTLGFLLAYVIRFEIGISWMYQPPESPIDFYQSFVFFITPGWLLIFAVFGLYDLKNVFSGMDEYARAFNACTFGMMFIIVLTFLYPTLVVARGWVVLSWLLISASMGLERFGFRRVVHQLHINGYFVRKIVIVGANEEGKAIAQQLQSHPKAGIKIIGFIDDKFSVDSEPVVHIPALGPTDSITKLIEYHKAHEVIIASTALPREKLLDLFQTLDSLDIPARMSSGLYEILTTGVEVQQVGNVPLLSVNKVRLTGAEIVLKRILDLAGATAAILMFLPIMIVLAIAIKLDSPGPIIYRRRVVGVGGKLFDAFKFRTMVTDADKVLAQNSALRQAFEQNHKLKDDPRVTRVGRFIRKTSLDEVPQLFNVLFGQMSLVGPRMITSPERAYYGKWSMNLFTVKPGMTGLWQVSGRSNVSYEERVRLDMHYIRNYSIWLDVYLLWLTIPAVLQRRGAF
ncbi:MAG: sugar transferase [Anaerolineae bacterium]|nr:sugar transferase [Anaerolineae bacterium]